MAKAQVGDVVGIHFDGRHLEVGDALVTPTGRMYLIIERRRQEKGKRRGRQHLRCAVVDSVPENITKHPLIWYKRTSSKHTPL